MSQVVTCPDRQALAAYSLGQCLDHEAVGLEGHLSGCPQCLTALQGLHVSDTLIDALKAQTVVIERPRCDGPVGTLMHRIKSLYPRPRATTDSLSFLAPAQSTDELGRLGEYRILEVLGSGGMGMVFRAEEMKLGREVALKVLRPELAESASARQRFLREACAAAGVQHDNIVPLLQVGEADGVLFLSMPLLHGESLDARIKREGPLPLNELVEIARQMAEGLAAAHAAGLIHRDVKPANVFVDSAAGTSSGEPKASIKLLDFGLARPITDEVHLTGTGFLVGTPLYMAPEQAEGTALDPRCDLFSLGSVLYTMATGRPPFRGDTCLGVLREVCDTRPLPVHEVNPEMPVWLSQLIAKLLAKKPQERFASARVVADLLRQCGDHVEQPAVVPLPSALGGGRRRSRRLDWIGIAACVFLILAGLVAFFGSSGIPTQQRPETFAGVLPTAPVVAPTPDAKPATPAQNLELQPVIAQPDDKGATVHAAALFPFEERGAGVKDMAAKITDLLFAKLSARAELVLVDRADLKKSLQELELNLSGAVKPGEATRIGQMTGAKLLITGSVLQVDKRTYLVAKIVGVETTRVVAVSVDGKSSDELAPLVDKLAQQIGETVAQQADKLVAKAAKATDRIAALKQKLAGKKDRPAVLIQISERHIRAPRIDPAAQTEFSKMCKELGFTLIDAEEGLRSKADLLVKGEGFSEFAARNGNLVSVKARVEIKVIDRKTGETIAVDRQTALVVDLTEQIAGKAALEQATAILAERLIPRMVGK